MGEIVTVVGYVIQIEADNPEQNFIPLLGCLPYCFSCSKLTESHKAYPMRTSCIPGGLYWAVEHIRSRHQPARNNRNERKPLRLEYRILTEAGPVPKYEQHRLLCAFIVASLVASPIPAHHPSYHALNYQDQPPSSTLVPSFIQSVASCSLIRLPFLQHDNLKSRRHSRLVSQLSIVSLTFCLPTRRLLHHRLSIIPFVLSLLLQLTSLQHCARMSLTMEDTLSTAFGGSKHCSQPFQI